MCSSDLAGPTVVVTDLAVYGFDADGEMALRTLHPGATIEAVRDSIGWKIRLPAGEVPTTRPPSAEELRLIREELDPTGAYV